MMVLHHLYVTAAFINMMYSYENKILIEKFTKFAFDFVFFADIVCLFELFQTQLILRKTKFMRHVMPDN